MSKLSRERSRREVARAIRYLFENGLVLEKEGNVSQRISGSETFAITPTRIPRATIEAEDVVVIGKNGRVVAGKRQPSGEVKLHLAIYRARPDVNAVAHFHPVYATALSVSGISVPPFLEEMTLFLGGGIPVAEFAPAGTDELGSKAVKALGSGYAILMKDHGALTCGSDMPTVLQNARLVEKVCRIYCLVKLLKR